MLLCNRFIFVLLFNRFFIDNFRAVSELFLVGSAPCKPLSLTPTNSKGYAIKDFSHLKKWAGKCISDFSKPPRLQGTSVSTLTLGDATPTAKHFENTVTRFSSHITLLSKTNEPSKINLIKSIFLKFIHNRFSNKHLTYA